MEIEKVVVIGSGTMGSGIAAHLCNANIPVTLLDLKTEISEQARDKIHKSRPPLLLDKSKINNIKVGNILDNFDEVKEADWVVEAVVERIDIKHDIYKKIFKERKDGGAADAIEHEKTGLICDGNELDEVYSSINLMLENNKFLEYGKTAKENSNKFKWNMIIEEYKKILN